MKLFVVYVVGDKIIMVLGACGQTGWSTVRDADVIAIEEVMNKWPLVMQRSNADPMSITATHPSALAEIDDYEFLVDIVHQPGFLLDGDQLQGSSR
jgi:hypothetical protein